MDDRAFASATWLSDEIRDRRIGCVELLDFYLARAERHNPTLNAIIVWQIDQARERARAADDALARGERSTQHVDERSAVLSVSTRLGDAVHPAEGAAEGRAGACGAAAGEARGVSRRRF